MSEGCKSVSRLLDAHVDGQLDAVKTLEVEDHVSSCETCRERTALHHALVGSLRKAVKSTTPDPVRARMLAAMAGERARVEAAASQEAAQANGLSNEFANEREAFALAADNRDQGGKRSRPIMLRHWRTALPLASAAAVALAWGFAGKQPLTPNFGGDTQAGLGLLDQFVDVHSHPIHPETDDRKVVRQFEKEVGVRVHVPRLQQNAQFVGGRLVHVQGGERAAMLQYEVHQGTTVQRVSVFIYDPNRVKVIDPSLAPRAVGTAQVRVGSARGYSVAVRQGADGVGYAVASDLDQESSATLVAAADRE